MQRYKNPNAQEFCQAVEHDSAPEIRKAASEIVDYFTYLRSREPNAAEELLHEAAGYEPHEQTAELLRESKQTESLQHSASKPTRLTLWWRRLFQGSRA